VAHLGEPIFRLFSFRRTDPFCSSNLSPGPHMAALAPNG
jgi:hypothetical protein